MNQPQNIKAAKMQIHRYHQRAHRNQDRQHDQAEQQVASWKGEPGEAISGKRGRHRGQQHRDEYVNHRVQRAANNPASRARA